MCDGSGATSWNHDIMGRTANEKRTIVGNSAVTKTITYTYNLDGSIASLKYPSGRTVTYGPSASGRPGSATDTANGINYVSWDCPQSGIYCYAPSGAEMRLKYGAATGFAGVITNNTYNSRLQPITLSAATTGSGSQTVLSLSYDFHVGNGDNGNVFRIVNDRDNNRTQNFTYDALSRIKTATTQGTSGSTCWGQMFGHMNGSTFVSGTDAWGNLNEITNTQCSVPTLSQVSTSQNQISGFCYDIAGNLLSQLAACPNSLPYNPVYVYDAENRLRSINQTITPYYTYDGDGKRVMKNYVGANRLYWTGAGSETLTETDLSGNATADYIYFNGKRVARVDLPGSAVHYYFSDYLGSSSVVTDNLGVIRDESDYYPYGGERTVTDSDSNRYKFTGKERDGESGFDNFGARYYSSALGRFVVPDWAAKPTTVPYATFGNPQSLNLYSYVKNSPEALDDPDGHGALNASTYSSSNGPLQYVEAEFGFQAAHTPQSQQPQQHGAPQQAAQNQQNNRTGYDTQDKAAGGALRNSNGASIKNNKEYAGLVYKGKDGRYYFTGPVGGGDQGSSPHAAKAPRGSSVVGDYHTHGDYSVLGPNGEAIRTHDPHRDDFNSDHFSGQDDATTAVDARGKPGYRSYLGTPSGKFLVYNPSTGQETALQ